MTEDTRKILIESVRLIEIAQTKLEHWSYPINEFTENEVSALKLAYREIGEAIEDLKDVLNLDI